MLVIFVTRCARRREAVSLCSIHRLRATASAECGLAASSGLFGGIQLAAVALARSAAESFWEIRYASSSAAASASDPGIRWPYRSRVIEIVACPMNVDSAFMFTPAAIISEAKVRSARLRTVPSRNGLPGSATMLRVFAGVYHELVIADPEPGSERMTDGEATKLFAKFVDHMEAPLGEESPLRKTGLFKESGMAPEASQGDLKKLVSLWSNGRGSRRPG